MDGGGRAHLDDLTDEPATDGISPHRRGWCGLPPLPEGQRLARERELCGACLAILKDVDWRSLLNDSALTVA